MSEVGILLLYERIRMQKRMREYENANTKIRAGPSIIDFQDANFIGTSAPREMIFFTTTMYQPPSISSRTNENEFHMTECFLRKGYSHYYVRNSTSDILTTLEIQMLAY